MKSLEAVETIYHEIKFNDKYQWSTGAEKVHGLSRLYLAKNGIEQQEAALSLVNLIVKYIGTDDVMLMGHRVHFDRAFTQQLTESIDIQLSYHPTTLDTASMATVLLEMSRSDDVFEAMGLPKRSAHNALEDIMYTLESVRKMKEYFITGLASTL